MDEGDGNLAELVDAIRQKSPELLSLLTAQTDGEFEDALDAVIEHALRHLEKNKKHFRDLDEEGLTAALTGRLSAPGLSVTTEANSNGHVDLTIEVPLSAPVRQWLGEAKIYDGPSYHCQGLAQLLERYSTGRDKSGLMLIYVRKKKIQDLIAKLRAHMDAQRPCNQTCDTSDHQLAWCFKSSHEHSSGNEIAVSHYACNLYLEQ